MSCAFPAQEGSSYVYTKHTMGEWFGVMAGACLTLEYGMSGAAVARSWGDKAARWLHTDLGVDNNSMGWTWFLTSDLGSNVFACLISVVTVALLAGGVKESKQVTNVMTALKIVLVVFMIVAGLFLMDTSNLTPFIPPELGMAGVARGATSSFFGYLGYDEVCCVAGEAINPRRDIPRAVLYTLSILSVLYVVAAFVLVGMQPWEEISAESGFPEAFRYNGWGWAAQIAAAGEVITLPVVVLICLMAQPRLQYALAKDGLLPKLFSEVDSTGNLKKGTIVAGSVMILVATFVPFQYIDDLISAGILVAFNMTDSAVILVRYVPSLTCMETKVEQSMRYDLDDTLSLLKRHLIIFHGLSFCFGMLAKHGGGGINGYGVGVCTILACLGVGIFHRVLQMAKYNNTLHKPITNHHEHVHITKHNGDKVEAKEEEDDEEEEEEEEPYFQTPFVPYLPCLGAFVNWYLIAQLELSGLFFLVIYLGAATLFYFTYGVKHSRLLKKQRQHKQRHLEEYEESMSPSGVGENGEKADDEEDYNYGGYDDNYLLRTISLPKTEYRATHMNT